MSSRTIFLCDRCGTESMADNYKGHLNEDWACLTCRDSGGSILAFEYTELCRTCLDQFKAWFTNGGGKLKEKGP